MSRKITVLAEGAELCSRSQVDYAVQMLDNLILIRNIDKIAG